jgi:hypothetical protein
MILGAIVEWFLPELFLQAREFHQAIGGKPLPSITQWVFDTLGVWSNGGLFCLFLLPWTVLQLFSLLSPRENDIASELRLIYGFFCFLICEASLFMAFAFAALLPFVPHYLRNPPEAPPWAFIPHVALGIVFAGVLIAAARKMVHRS